MRWDQHAFKAYVERANKSLTCALCHKDKHARLKAPDNSRNSPLLVDGWDKTSCREVPFIATPCHIVACCSRYTQPLSRLPPSLRLTHGPFADSRWAAGGGWGRLGAAGGSGGSRGWRAQDHRDAMQILLSHAHPISLLYCQLRADGRSVKLNYVTGISTL